MDVPDIVQETGIKTIPKKKKCKKAKWLSEEALQIAVKRWEGKAKMGGSLKGYSDSTPGGMRGKQDFNGEELDISL